MLRSAAATPCLNPSIVASLTACLVSSFCAQPRNPVSITTPPLTDSRWVTILEAISSCCSGLGGEALSPCIPSQTIPLLRGRSDIRLVLHWEFCTRGNFGACQQPTHRVVQAAKLFT